MLIYIITLFLIAIFSLYPYMNNNTSQSRRIYLYLSFTIMTFILGLRGKMVGEDTQHYLHIFKNAANVKWLYMIRSAGMRTGYYTDEYGYTDTIENGFLIIAKVVHWFTDNGQIFLFLVAAATCILFAKFIYDNCKKVVFPTYIFLCESMFMIAFNGARQILAAAVAVQAYTYLKNRKWKKAIFIILIASLIHNVALICFALFPIMMIEPKKEFRSFKYAMIATIAAPFGIVLAQAIVTKLFPRYIAYFSSNFWTNHLGGISILWSIEFILIMVCYVKHFKVENSFRNSCLVLVYLTCELMGLRITMFSRVGWFFRPYLMVFLPGCKNYFTKRTWQLIQSTLVILLTLLYFSYARTPARLYTFFWQ